MLPGPETGRRIIDYLARIGGYLTPFEDKRHTDIYLDTPSQTLQRAGYAYRIRSRGQRRIATVKSITRNGPGSHRGISDRLEIETALPEDSLMPSDNTPLAAFLKPILGTEPLEPLFTVVTLRETWRLEMTDPAVTATVALDTAHYEFTDGNRSDRHHELEIELSRTGPGDTEALAVISRRIRDVFHVEPGTLSKYERGCAKIPMDPADTPGKNNMETDAS